MIPIAGMLASAGIGLIGDLIKGGSNKAKELIQEKTGINLDTKESLSAEDIKALKEFEKTHELELTKLRLTDLKDARNMQNMALSQDDKFSKRFVYYFAIGWSVFAMAFLAGITFWEVPEASTRFADTIVGFLLGTIVSTIIGFFYGSSER